MTAELIHKAQNAVREAGYNACMHTALKARGKAYSRSMTVYNATVEVLRLTDPLAETFRIVSWNPHNEEHISYFNEEVQQCENDQ